MSYQQGSRKISALSSSIIDKCEYLTGEEILPSGQSKIIKQANFTYSPLGKACEKRTKATEDAAEKEAKAVENRIKKQTLDKSNFNH